MAHLPKTVAELRVLLEKHSDTKARRKVRRIVSLAIDYAIKYKSLSEESEISVSSLELVHNAIFDTNDSEEILLNAVHSDTASSPIANAFEYIEDMQKKLGND